MAFLVPQDYMRQITDLTLQQVISGSEFYKTTAEGAALSEIRSYLSTRYDLDKELTDTPEYSSSVTYKAGSRVVDDLSDLKEWNIYYAVFPKPVFNLEGYYNVGDKVFWKDHTYTAKKATYALSHNDQLQYGTTNNFPYQNVFPDDPIKGSTYWTDNGAYSVPAGTALSNGTYWVKGDNRNQQIVMICVDLVLYHLYSRLDGKGVPVIRQDRYNAAISWLKQASKSDGISADLVKIQPPTGGRIRYGSKVKNENSY